MNCLLYTSIIIIMYVIIILIIIDGFNDWKKSGIEKKASVKYKFYIKILYYINRVLEWHVDFIQNSGKYTEKKVLRLELYTILVQ